jgi:hypothetical protein
MTGNYVVYLKGGEIGGRAAKLPSLKTITNCHSERNEVKRRISLIIYPNSNEYSYRHKKLTTFKLTLMPIKVNNNKS